MHTSREGGERFSEISPPFRTAKTMVRVNMTVIVLPSVRARWAVQILLRTARRNHDLDKTKMLKKQKQKKQTSARLLSYVTAKKRKSDNICCFDIHPHINLADKTWTSNTRWSNRDLRSDAGTEKMLLYVCLIMAKAAAGGDTSAYGNQDNPGSDFT